jgi:aspartyl-tRNA(Asn)/glutamyl-tRNA(Gln) amidotransferase subunit B
MKGYQISQFDKPIGKDGSMIIVADGKERRAGINRVHLEEDVAKLMHRATMAETYTLVDVNRSGIPMMEIVGEPDLRSPEEARQYLMKLRSILQYLGVSTANMEEGAFRCDANISIRPVGSNEYLTKVEVKNMNSFRAVFRALEYEAVRQRKAVETGERIVQETRGWVEEKSQTVSQRSKEYAHDYRYFPEPDLPPMVLDKKWVTDMKTNLPELPEARLDRFVGQYGLPAYDAGLLTAAKSLAEYFEKLVKTGAAKTARDAGNWLLGPASALMNMHNMDINDFTARIDVDKMAGLLRLESKSVISTATAKAVLEEMFNSGKTADEIVKEKGLGQISDSAAIEEQVEAIIKANPQAVADFRAGKETAIKFLVGQVMKATRGRANPQLVNDLVKKKLTGV